VLAFLSFVVSILATGLKIPSSSVTILLAVTGAFEWLRQNRGWREKATALWASHEKCDEPDRERVIDQVVDDVDVTLITRRDAPNAVVMSQEHCDSLMETVHLLSSLAHSRSVEGSRPANRQANSIAPEQGNARSQGLRAFYVFYRLCTVKSNTSTRREEGCVTSAVSFHCSPAFTP
jgi:antitoxin YefM